MGSKFKMEVPTYRSLNKKDEDVCEEYLLEKTNVSFSLEYSQDNPEYVQFDIYGTENFFSIKRSDFIQFAKQVREAYRDIDWDFEE